MTVPLYDTDHGDQQHYGHDDQPDHTGDPHPQWFS